eukprot:6040300-Pleurochrysis_carterae.AAC.4
MSARSGGHTPMADVGSAPTTSLGKVTLAFRSSKSGALGSCPESSERGEESGVDRNGEADSNGSIAGDRATGDQDIGGMIDAGHGGGVTAFWKILSSLTLLSASTAMLSSASMRCVA